MVKTESIASNCTYDDRNCSFNKTDYSALVHNLSNTYYYAHPGEMLTPWSANEYFFFIISTYIFTFIVGVAGNITSISMILGDKTYRNVTNLFLVSLAAADLLLLAICAPLDVGHYFVVQWDSEGTVCKLAAYAETVSAFSSVLNLVAVTIERFLVIVFPIRSRSLCSMRNCRRAVILVWGSSLVLAIPAIFGKSTVKRVFFNNVESVTSFSCKDSENFLGLAVSIYRLVTLFILPSMVMIVCYTWVIKELWISTRTVNELTNNLDRSSTISRELSRSSISNALDSHDSNERAHAIVKSSRKQVIKMLILVVLLFLVCWGPRLVMDLYMKCCLTEYNDAAYFMRFVFYLLPFVHSCLNPFVYCSMSSKFQARLMKCCGRVNPPVTNQNNIPFTSRRNFRSVQGSTNTIFSRVISPSSFEIAP